MHPPRVYERVCVGGLRLPGSECGFSPIFAPVSRTFSSSPPPLSPENPPSRHSPPRYPCFALADLIRDSALNLVRYTAVCMPRLALPATSATHTLSPSRSLSPLPSRAYYLLSVHAGIYTYTATRPYPGSPRLLFPPCSPVVLSRAEIATRRLPSFSFLFLSFSPPDLSVFISFSPSLFILPQRLHLSVFLSTPQSSFLSPRTTTPASSSRPSPPSLSREGTLADAPDVSTVRLSLPSTTTDANGVVTTTDVALPPPSSTALLGSDLRFSSPFPRFRVELSERKRRRRRRRPLVRI